MLAGTMRILPVAAAMLAIPAALGMRDPRDADGGSSQTDDVEPLPAMGAMESPAFGQPAPRRSVEVSPARRSTVHEEAREQPALRPAGARSPIRATRVAPVAPMAAAPEPAEAGFATWREAGPAPSAMTVARPEPLLRHAALELPAPEIDPARSDADETAIAPALLAQGATLVSAPAPAGNAAPRLEYDSANLESAPERAPALAYDTRGLDEAVTSDAAERGPPGPGSTMPTISYPEAGSEESVFAGDFLIVAVGAVALPSYEGSNDTAVIPAGAIAGNLKGIGINPRAGGIALDLVPDGPGAKIGLSLGPVVRLRGNRTAHIKDPIVARLPKLDTIFEAGVAAGVSLARVLNPHDKLSLGLDMRWDVSGHGSGYVVAPAMSYLTPLSRAMVAGLTVSAEFADGRYAHYNYDVTAAGAVASGLPAYSAKGGLKSVNYGMFIARDLNANLLDGGLAIGVGGMYGHLYGSAAETPITAIRGSRGQWIVGGGLGYVF